MSSRLLFSKRYEVQLQLKFFRHRHSVTLPGTRQHLYLDQPPKAERNEQETAQVSQENGNESKRTDRVSFSVGNQQLESEEEGE